MTQHNNNLSLNQQGKDVALLHSQLSSIGYVIDTSEIIGELFGQSTYQAVLSFQRLAGLPVTGVVDDATTRAIVSRREAMMMSRPQPVQSQAASPSPGTASQEPGEPVEVVRGATPPPPQTPQPSPTPPQSIPGVHPGSSTPGVIGEKSPQRPSDMPQQPSGSGSPPGATIPLPEDGRPPFGVPGSPPLPIRPGLWVVQGHVHLSDGSPLSGVTVQALKAVVGHDPAPIAQAQASTDADGAYALHYAANAFAETRAAALIVRALAPQGNVLATSPLVPHPGEVITEDLVVSTGAAGISSEYERLVNVVGPQLVEVDLLENGSLSLVQKLAALKPVDLDLLAQVPGLDRARLQLLSGAAGLQEQAQGLSIEVPAPVFYGLAREGMPLDPIGLFNRGTPAIQDALQRAVKENVISSASAGTVEATLGAIQRFVVEETLRTPPAPGLQPIGDLLGLLLTPDQQITFLTLQASNKDSPQQFWATLSQQPGFQAPGLVNSLQVNEQLYQLTQGNIPLVAALRQSYSFSSPRELVRLTQAQWVELINKQANGKPVGLPPGVPGTTPQDQVNEYVATIMGTLQKLYPTDAAAQIIAGTSNLNMEPRIRQGVLQFFTNSPTFDLLRTHVDQYLAANKDTALKGIAETDQTDVVAQVKRVQRIHRLSDSPGQKATLLGTRFDSARAIAAVPQANFVTQMQEQLGGETTARQVHERAQAMNALALHVATTLYNDTYGVLPAVLSQAGSASPGGSPSGGLGSGSGAAGGTPGQAGSEGIPTLTSLFGSLDTCACDECRSMLGPSAYLVDLLQLLLNTAAQPQLGTNSPSMQEVLFDRRPDIPLLNLTCENADTPLPYIDLVNEILETYVAVYSWNFHGQSSAQPITLSQYSSWLASEATYVHNGANSGTNDTGDATPDELLASPQYLIPAAYTELQSTIYPFTLPFDLFVETARVYLQSQGSSLYQVMQTFQPDGLAVNPPAPYATTSQSLNGEYLKMAPGEYRLLTGQQQFTDPSSHQLLPATTADYYGYTLHPGGSTMAWGDPSKLSTVCEFLARTGLTLAELVQLLNMRTVNPYYPVMPVLEQLGLDYVEVWSAQPTFSTLSPDILAALQAAHVSANAFTGWISQQHLGQVIVIAQQTATMVSGTPVILQCDPCKMTLQHVDGTALSDGEWRWLYLFIRLWRKLSWAMPDLDNALANWLLPWPWTTLPWPWTQQTGDMRQVVDRLSQVAQLHDMLNVPVADLLPLWVDFTGDGTTLANEWLNLISPRFQQLFLNKALGKIDPVFQPTWQGVTPNPADPTTIPAGQPASLDNHIFAIVAAFRISQDDLTTIRGQTGLLAPTSSATLVPLTMQTLSTIYRRVMLARVLKLRIPDLFALIALSGLDPFSDPAATIQFVHFVQTIQRSTFSIAQLNYLCRDLDTSPPSLVPRTGDMTELAIQLRAGLANIASETQQVADPTGAVLQNMLGMIFDAPTVAQAMHMLDGTQLSTAPLTPASNVTTPTLVVPQDLQSRVSYVASQGSTQGLLQVRGPLSTVDWDELMATSNPYFTDFTTAVNNVYSQPQVFVANAFGGFLSTQQAQTDALSYLLLIGQNVPSPAPTPADKYQYVLQRFLPFLCTRLSHGFVKKTLATALKLDPAVVAALLENPNVLHSRANGTDMAIVDALALTAASLTASYDYLSESTTLVPHLQTIDVSFPPSDTISAVYDGTVTSESAGAYSFSITTSPGALVQLTLSDQGAAVVNFSALAPLSTGVMAFPSCTLAANHAYDLKLTIFFPNTAPYGTVTAAHLYWTPPAAQSQALTPGSFTANYTTLSAQTPRAVLSVQPAESLSAFGSGAAWSPGVTGLPSMLSDTAAAAYSGTITVPAGTPNPVGFHLLADTGALMSWVILDQQNPPHQVGGSNGWQSLQSGRADWTCSLTPGQPYTLAVQVMANAAAGSFTCNALTGVQVMWDTTAPMLLVSASSASVVYGVAIPWPAAGSVQSSTTLVPTVACMTADGSLPAGTFRAEYQGTLLVTTAGTYTFSVTADAGAQVWLTIGAITYGPITVPSPVSGTVSPATGTCHFLFDLAAGEANSLDLVILAQGASTNQAPLSTVELSWSSATQLQAIVPSQQFIPTTILGTFEELYTVLSKIALLVTQFHLTADEIEYFSANSAQFGGFDLDLIAPTSATTRATQLMALWLRVNAYATLRSSLPQSQATTLLDIFRAAVPGATMNGIAQAIFNLTGWDQTALNTLLGVPPGTSGLNLTVASFVNDVAVTRLQTCLRAVTALGIAPDKLIQWATDALQGAFGDADADDVKKTIKARYDDSAWPGVTRPLTDALRQQQRDALVAYILGLGLGGLNGLTVGGVPVTDTNLLYEYLLIDTEMSPCMLTSRIVQATAAVQLFVQRCQLGLEAPAVDPQAMPDEVWSWMKLYRFWQANREVFLWPENYIVESLRDDKTPFYREFESELLQGQLTDDTIESAVINYVAKLDQVANLEMCGLYWEQSDDPKVDILHVFGRTRNTPHVYFYRQLQNQASWTPWERVQLDIEGDHLIPVVWNRRLYLFWPRFTMKSMPATSTTSSQQTYWEIALAWSEYKNGTWRPKEVSKEVGYIPGATGVSSSTAPGAYPGDISKDFPPEVFTFRAVISDDGSLAVVMYLRRNIDLGFQADVPGYVDKADPQLEFDFNGSGGHLVVNSSPSQPVTWSPALKEFDYMTFLWDPADPFMGPTGGMLEFEPGDNVVLNRAASGKFNVLPPAGIPQFEPNVPFFVQDAVRAYLSLPTQLSSLGSINAGGASYQTTADLFVTSGSGGATIKGGGINTDLLVERFSHHFHPYVGQFVGDLTYGGIAELLTLDNQKLSEGKYDALHRHHQPGGGFTPGNIFYDTYSPTQAVIEPYPYEQVDFGRNQPDCPYTDYNWELFFHIPFRVAPLLSENFNFDAAETMFRYIFDITRSPNSWQFFPFTGVDVDAEQIQNLLLNLNQLGSQSSVHAQIAAMQQRPFEPHLLARMRPSAYMKAVVMQYISHHLAWGDHLYRQADQASDRELLNEAMQHYILVSQLLGPRPQIVPNPGKTKPQNYNQLKADKLDLFSNTLAALENEFPFIPTTGSGQGSSGGTAVMANVFYFCIPQNNQLLGYWDTVEDRLFKIRNCMTIDGVVQQLPLFAPPINPMLLVQAVAQGIDLGSILSDLSAPLPYYRFSYIHQKALELCADVRAFGAMLLAALEKKDAEALAALHASHETALLQAISDVKQAQLDEANQSLAALNGTRHITEARFAQYQEWLGSTSVAIPPFGQASDQSQGKPPGQQYNDYEKEHLDQLSQAQQWQDYAADVEVAASAIDFFLPDISIPMGPGVPSSTVGGSHIGAALYAVARYMNALAAHHTSLGTVASIKGAFDRRDEEWRLQLTLATRELEQIDQQIAAANTRVEIASKEIANNQLQVSHAQAIEDLLHDKFTNQDLYDWMQGQLSTLYYQAYSMAYDLAKQAERAYRFERGLTDSNYIQFGYWDSAHNGLVAGEQLHLALKQLERAYHDQNKRDYEITKQISLAQVDPIALVMLKETGVCEIELPEALFDADYPSHYMRRVKTMAVTIPCVVGPYTSINCTLTLLSNITRTSSDATAPYAEGDNDARFVHNFASVQSIATSHGQNDAGLFELNFRDERYLPFEGAGAVSRWRIELPRESNAFDFNTITDVILRLQYTARDGGMPLRKSASESLAGDINTTSGARLFSAKHEFAAAWVQFLNPTDPNSATLQLDLSKDRFSYQLRGKKVQIQTVNLYLFLDELVDLSQVQPLSFTLNSPDKSLHQSQFKLDLAGTTPPVPLPVMSAIVPKRNGLPISTVSENRGLWSLALPRQSIPLALAPDGSTQPPYTLDAKKVRDMLIVCEYAIS